MMSLSIAPITPPAVQAVELMERGNSLRMAAWEERIQLESYFRAPVVTKKYVRLRYWESFQANMNLLSVVN